MGIKHCMVASLAALTLAGCGQSSDMRSTNSGATQMTPPAYHQPSLNQATMMMAQAVQQTDGRADPQMRAVIDALASMHGKPIAALRPAEARMQPSAADAAMAVMKQQGKTGPEPVGNVQNRQISTTGGTIPVRVYTPNGNGPFPVVVYFHGGGWVIATLDTYDASCRALTNLTRAVLVSVDYRQAPEHKYPAAPMDCYAATQYVMNHAQEFQGDSSRVAVAGESAGGNLATVVCLMAKDKGGKMPIHQLLVYPITQAVDLSTASYTENASAVPLDKDTMAWFIHYYLSNPSQARDAYVSPLTSGDLRGLPPATIITDQIDPLRSDGQLYAQKLRAAGVQVAYRNYEGVTHEFFGMGAVVDKAKEAEQFAADGLKSAFNGSAAMNR